MVLPFQGTNHVFSDDFSQPIKFRANFAKKRKAKKDTPSIDRQDFQVFRFLVFVETQFDIRSSFDIQSFRIAARYSTIFRR